VRASREFVQQRALSDVIILTLCNHLEQSYLQYSFNMPLPSIPVELWTEIGLQAEPNDARNLRMTSHKYHRHILAPKSLRLITEEEAISFSFAVFAFHLKFPDSHTRGGFANIFYISIQFDYVEISQEDWKRLQDALILLKVFQLNVEPFWTESTRSWLRVAKLTGQLANCHTLRLLSATSVVSGTIFFKGLS